MKPDLFAYLTSAKETQARLTGGPGAWNILAGGKELYPESADDFALGQVATFLAAPVRRISFVASNFLFEEDQTDEAGNFTPKPLNAERVLAQLPDDRDYIAGDFAKTLVRSVDGAVLPWSPDPDAGHLIAYGLGLGLHLPSLVAALPVREVVIVDSFPEFLKLSLRTVDWAGLAAELRARGGGLWIEMGKDPAVLAAIIEGRMQGVNYCRIDGAYMVKHYDFGPIPAVIERVMERNATLEMSRGFFEDEVVMVRNAAANLSRWDHAMLVDQPHGSVGARPAVVMGSGPSVDAAAPELKRLVEAGAVLFCAGTALRVALSQGLAPAFVCMLENGPGQTDVVRVTAQDFSLDGVTLIASTTVDPDMAGYFDTRIFYHRDSLTSTALFAGTDRPIHLSGPTVANLACRAAVAFGFEEIYLFGVDLGAVERERHHSDASVYATYDDDFWRAGRGMERLTLPIKGNFREQVFTSGQFLLTRGFFELLFAHYPDRRFYNCSDGAAISGAQALPPAQATCTAGLGASEPTVVEILTRLPHRSAGGAGISGAITQHREACMAWAHRLADAIEAGTGSLDEFIDQVVETVQHGAPRREERNPAAAAFAGSLLSMAQVTYVLYRRLAPERRAAFLSLARAEMARQVRRAADQIDEALRVVETGEGMETE